ncbi:MAP/microtubule affinity-regulating kinase 3-like [Ursus arctos]|uniref:MAP/microtubule affinity-regulating kinase 3-like n=1 Tax=Ursus arctos TaxID=9644 RepID=UPI002017DA3D|nr:MAP/microtubule affinity-regulating kinase 3-like [Ursus arctos]
MVLNHPNIMKLFEMIGPQERLHLVMEYASEGEMIVYPLHHSHMKEKEDYNKFLQIVSAVQCCHPGRHWPQASKPENLRLDADLNVKVMDFGFGNKFTCGDMQHTFCGSPPDASPELF